MVKSVFIACTLIVIASCHQKDGIDYSTQVKPIINKKCIACHGGVKKQGGFSFLFEEEAKAKLKSGKYAIVPGKPQQSEVIRRISLADPEERMPYHHTPLSPEEVTILTEWIQQGAPWGKHWAYESIQKQTMPESKSEWPKNDIDRFVLKKATELGLSTSQPASPEVLARRVALDIIGYAAPDSLTSAFIQSPDDKHYEKLVDDLLASPHYGEKWTSMWLDLARYADTKGYERDDHRTIWRYRDWLIKAFNQDMPYDQFIKEQLAGDLLPHPTEDQYIATAFHRNTMTNDEGGTDNEEFRVAAVIDRVNTTWETLMSTSFACVQCHSHPYDPFQHEDYYRFMAYFNNTRDADTYEDYPAIRHLDKIQEAKLISLQASLTPKTDSNQIKEITHFIKTLQPAVYSLEGDSFINCELSDTKWLAMRNPSSARLARFPLENKDALIFRYQSSLKQGLIQLRADRIDGELIGTFNIRPTKGWKIDEIPLVPLDGVHDIFILFTSDELKDPIKTGIKFDYFHPGKKIPFNDSNAKQNFWDLLNAPCDVTPILLENTSNMSRTTQVFERGSWLAKKDTVQADVPKIFKAYATHKTGNRLDLAQWMTSPEHPLTSRTIVNRLWEQLWGTGIVETLEDMGSQGASPSHQALLDHLSWKLMHEYHWSLKSLLKEMVMSATYRQDSRIHKEALSLDPTNKYLCRGPRVRLSAEQLRDQALAAAGVMNDSIYGPPVMPYQPDGVWLSPYNGYKWVKNNDHNQYRRALYTFWKRTSPYPGMSNFDAIGREVCSSRRIRTNTPLQALTILNDSAYIDLAGHLADRVGWDKPNECIAVAFRLLTGKAMDKERAKVFLTLYDHALSTYLKNKTEQNSKDETTTSIPAREAMIIVANTLLNLDEVITKT